VLLHCMFGKDCYFVLLRPCSIWLALPTEASHSCLRSYLLRFRPKTFEAKDVPKHPLVTGRQEPFSSEDFSSAQAPSEPLTRPLELLLLIPAKSGRDFCRSLNS
jgi:hypothetical protein